MKRCLSALCCAILCITIPGAGLLETVSAGNASANMQKKKKQARKKQAKRKVPRRRNAKQRTGRPNRNRANGKRRPANANRNNKKQSSNNAQRNNAKRRKSSKEDSKKEPAEKTPFVHVKSWKETQEMIAKHKGKVVVVDLWASWCQPCIKEFPNLVALQKKYPKDVVTYSFNTDNDGLKDTSLEKIRLKVKAFLTKHKAVDLQNVVSRESDEKTFAAANIDSIPTILIFDRAGKLAKKIDPNAAGGKDPSYEKHVVPVVERLIKKK